MALRVNTNVAAINAHRQLLGTESSMGKNMERLSSGFRINHASDDAAGLSIANRLRTNVRSLTVASRNVSEARAMVTVAEGAVNQVEGIVERMKELATQAASDNAATDRSKLKTEYDSLADEIDRIVSDTEYQGTNLIDGTFGATAAVSHSTTFTAGEVHLSGAAAGTYSMTANAGNLQMTDGSITQEVAFSANSTLNFDALGISIETNTGDTSTTFAAESITVGGSGGSFQVGSGGSSQDQIDVTISGLDTSTLGIAKGTVALDSVDHAQTALGLLDAAVNTINTQLGSLGATVNRMDYAYSNLQVTIENQSASESVIRDVDMAAEMVGFTKNQILMQAGTSMLAQANMSTQGVLSLMG